MFSYERLRVCVRRCKSFHSTSFVSYSTLRTLPLLHHPQKHHQSHQDLISNDGLEGIKTLTSPRGGLRSSGKWQRERARARAHRNGLNFSNFLTITIKNVKGRGEVGGGGGGCIPGYRAGVPGCTICAGANNMHEQAKTMAMARTPCQPALPSRTLLGGWLGDGR